jgi:hypothetical protein
MLPLLGDASKDPPQPTASNLPRTPHSIIRRILEVDLSWALLLVVLNVGFFGDALFADKTFFVRDVSFFHYPLKRLVTEAYKQGHWPLWNPYIQLGQPLLANPNAMALYPTQVLFQLLPFELAFNLHFVLHCMLAGLATFYLMRELGASRSAAFLSAELYNFSGVTLSFLNLFNILPVVALLPLLALALARTLRHFSLVAAGCTSLLFGVFFLLLEPLSSLAVALFLIPFVVWIMIVLVPRRKISLRKEALLFAVIIGSGLCLAAGQIFPTLELMNYSGRKGGLDFDVVSFWSLHPVSLLQVVIPRLFGEYFRLAEPPPWGNLFFDNREPYLLSCYLGFFSLLLALFGGIFMKKRGLNGFLLGISFVALLLALGKHGPIYPWLFHNIPIFRYGRYPVKFLVVVTFCISLLAGFGLERLEELRPQLWNGPTRTRWGVLFFASFALALLCFFMVLSPQRILSFLTEVTIAADHIALNYQGNTLNLKTNLITESLRNVQIQLASFVVFLGLVLWKKIRPNIVRGTVLSLVLFDLLINNFWINPLISSDFYAPAPAAVFLGKQFAQEGPGRIYNFEQNLDKERVILGQTDSVAWVALYRKLTLFQFLAAKDHVQYSVFNPIDRLETLSSQDVRAELAAAPGLDEKLEILAGLNVAFVVSTKEIRNERLSLEGLFQVNSNQPFRIYRLRNRLPRVFLLDVSIRECSNQSNAGSTGVPNVAPIALSTNDLIQLQSGRAQITNYSSDRVDINASAERPSLLVLLDGKYPGWNARIDGALVPVRSFRETFRAVSLPSGNHNVTFTYSPMSFWTGFCLSSFTVFAWTLGLIANRAAAIKRKLGLDG